MSCKICFEKYNETNRIPMIAMQCGHSFCKLCLESQNICPLCRQEITNVKPNYELIEFTNEFNKNDSKEINVKKNKINILRENLNKRKQELIDLVELSHSQLLNELNRIENEPFSLDCDYDLKLSQYSNDNNIIGILSEKTTKFVSFFHYK